MLELMAHQKDAIKNLANGKILYGGVGSGKSATVLGYYMEKERPRDIYVITTAKKRDSLDWQGEAAQFGISDAADLTLHGTLTVDSWNNIGNYLEVEDAFFVFDEQRLVGTGHWVKSFMKIAKKNHWVMLSATPGDTWLDYAPVFVANGFFKSITEFKRKHVLYEPFRRYPVVKGYLNELHLELLRNEILVEMPYEKDTERILNWLEVGCDADLLRQVYLTRWHIYEDRPVIDASDLFWLMRKIINSDPSRLDMVRELMKTHPKLIIFYNFDYELEILRQLEEEIPVGELNGHRKTGIPETDRWVYLVQYVAGAEAWNCVETDAMILYSLTYSYKNFEQAQGRIDRMNTTFTNLYYYILVSNSVVDLAIRRALGRKENFNRKRFMRELDENEGFGEDYLEVCER